MDEVDIDRRLARIESRIVQLMLWCGMEQGKDGQIAKEDKPGGIFKALRKHERDAAARAKGADPSQGD